MRRSLLPVGLLVAAAAGCAAPKSGKALADEQVAAMNEVAAVLDTITDDAAAGAAMPKLEKAAARLKAANQAAARTQPRGGQRQPTQQEIDQAMELAKPLMEAGLRMAAAAINAQARAPGHAARIRQVVESAGVEPPGGR